MFTPKTRTYVKEVERAIREKTITQSSFVFITPTELCAGWKDAGRRFTHADGTPLKSYGIGIDITERKLEELDRGFCSKSAKKFVTAEISRENTLPKSRK
jgi:hypothetical protein